MKTIKAKVEVYDGSTLVATCTCSDTGEAFAGANSLANFTIGREGEMGKFFGFGVSHKLDMTLIDLEKVLRLYEGFTAKVALGDGITFDTPYPDFTFNSVKVDKKTGDIHITAYDQLFAASELTYDDIKPAAPYTLRQLTTAIATALGLTVSGMDSAFDISYEEGGNYNGDELLRLVLNHIAEVTQTIYYVNSSNQLVFKRLGTTAVGDYYRKDYYEFETASTKTITGICNATELGENIEHNPDGGVVQFIRDNGLWELRPDLRTLLEAAVNRVNGLSITQFELDWSGDYRLEIGDLINIHYDDDITSVYILSDMITYGGTLNEETAWQYVESEETFTNPSTIGERINQTFARVDKVDKKITLYVGQIEENASDISQLEIDANSITATVEGIKEATKTGLEDVNEDLAILSQKVSSTMTSDQIKILISESLQDGVNTVTTSTGFTFNDEGLHINKSGSDLSSSLDETGLEVNKTGDVILTAKADGVNALNLTSRQYLSVANCRFEKYGSNRMGCYWIGGN